MADNFEAFDPLLSYWFSLLPNYELWYPCFNLLSFLFFIFLISALGEEILTTDATSFLKSSISLIFETFLDEARWISLSLRGWSGLIVYIFIVFVR